MTTPHCDVIVVGAGAAGLTAAIGLARSGFRVAVVEAAAFPGAENWSGCVYFTENLAHPDILGPEGVEALAWERRLVERGFFATDGHGLLGMKYRDADAFRHCYTVLRPIYDHHLAQFALRHGAKLLTSTTAESLIREGEGEDGRIIGVCTNRGPLYATLTFLAEGDASHLVTREGYDRSSNPADMPKFLQGIKQVLELPPRAIEERFGVEAEQGVAYEMLLRNGTLRGKPVHLNMGGFLYTNRQSLSVGLVLPADNLHEHFEGDPNLLMEWFLSLPSLRPWFAGAKPGPFGAKIIRGGGAQDIPTLIDNGLAIGGAASAIGIDFPYPNFTGPATAMGLLITHAARQIRDNGGSFSRAELERHYLQPLRKTHYWQDVEFLRHWPGYVKKTSVFFGQNLDMALGSAHLWTRPGKALTERWQSWTQFIANRDDGAMAKDVQHFREALRIREVLDKPSPWRLLLDGALNTLRDAVGAKRALPAHGNVSLHYSIAGGAEPGGLPSPALRRAFESLAPAIAAAARIVYSNEAVSLARKLPTATRLLSRHVSLRDIGRAFGFGAMAALQWTRTRFNGNTEKGIAPETAAYFRAAHAAGDLTPASLTATQTWDARLGQLSYETVKASHIHVLWPQSLAEKNEVTKAGLWHVCPAHVYEARVSATGQLQVVVNFENCIKCETCWRTSDIVDWGRDGAHRFVYAVHSPVVDKLLADMEQSVNSGQWAESGEPSSVSCRVTDDVKVLRLITQLDRKLAEFDEALAAEPRTFDRDRAEYLALLARCAHQLALEISSCSRNAQWREVESDSTMLRCELQLNAIAAITHRRMDHAVAGRHAWAAADGRLLRHHHLRLGSSDLLYALLHAPELPSHDILLPETSNPRLTAMWQQRFNAVFPQGAWRILEQRQALSREQQSAILDIVSEARPVEMRRLSASPPLPSSCPKEHFFHHPERKWILAFLAQRDPSLAFRGASHLVARDLASIVGGSFQPAAERWARGDEWACVVPLRDAAKAQLMPLHDATAMLFLQGNYLSLFPTSEAGLAQETLGLRGAGLASAGIQQHVQPQVRGELENAEQNWQILSAADLTSIAHGIADYLCERAIDHAANRVQFPGLFHDEQAHDTIGKFGAVKKMLAEMAAGRNVIAMLDHVMTPAEFSPAAANRACLVKAIATEVLGTAPGSIAYNAGQIFGGTGYSEDDTLSKYYRDAATLRFAGVAHAEACARHGSALLHNWTANGERLSTIASEMELMEAIRQRQMLARELGVVCEYASRLVQYIDSWKFASATLCTVNAQAAFAEAVGRQDTLQLVSKQLLACTHVLFENGKGNEMDLALLRTWLRKRRDEFDAFTTLIASFRDSGHAADAVGPVATRLLTQLGSPSSDHGSPILQYADFLKADLPYSSGDFLGQPTDATRPRYVPEMVETDDYLSKRNQELIDLITRQFGAPRNGMVYERYLEQQHRPDSADLDFLRKNGFFRAIIPKELGGEGRCKADYYLLVVNTHRLADAAISLTIQVNSSLGTTPVLLARDKDLPKAIKATPPGELQDELKRRLEAADLFCRWVASGQISAFALTEPSAGSDTARVATRAKLRQVPVEREADGVYRFVPVGSKVKQRLIDARRVVFSASAKPQAAYSYSDSAEPAPIHCDEYDYETDFCKKRYFIADNQRVYFDDIAQLRERDGKLWYDYWELTGAKMWITNGRIMGIMVLYAKTDAGVTGFMVDRHAEGLVVGKDEAKMGQNGSPTNELALQAVRVPRENVVGLEGRGQVNALETLNVGRAGLAMSAMCQMANLCNWSRAFALNRHGEIPPWIGWRLEWMEAERFIAEAMAYEIIGRFEHKQTKSIRMESAIAKMLVSELYHHSIELAEEIHGPEGQTQEHLIEKRKRDARVLNIYEGTNEIQRFLILKELTEIAPTWTSRERKGQETSPDTSPSQQIDSLKQRLRDLTTEAVQLFGQQLWQNPNLQANCFVLSEAVAWVAAAESTLGRLTWLTRKGDAELDLLTTGQRALTRCLSEVDTRLKRFAEDLVQLRRGYYAPEIRAASLLFQRQETPAVEIPDNVISRPLSVLVVLDAPTPGAPQPRARDGRVMEPYRVLTEGDRAALETALRLRDAGTVRIEVVAVASAIAVPILREALSLGVDRVRLIAAPTAVPADGAATALGQVLRGEPPFDLILGGASAGDGQEGLVARLTAEVIGVPCAGSAVQLAINTTENVAQLVGGDGQKRTRVLPATVTIEPRLTLRNLTTAGWFAGLVKVVEMLSWPADVPAARLEYEETATVAATTNERPSQTLLPREASQVLLEAAGIAVAAPAVQPIIYDGFEVSSILDTAGPSFAAPGGGPVIVAVLAADATGKLLPTARRALDAAQFLTPFFQGAAKVVLLVVPRNDEAQQRALAELTVMTPFDVCVLAVDSANVSDEIRCRLLAECWSGLESFPVAVVGEPWTESAFVSLAAASGTVDPIALRVRLLDRYQGRLVAEGTSAKGKLRTRQALLEPRPDSHSTLWIALAAEAEVGATEPAPRRPARRVERWLPRLEQFFGRDDMQRLVKELKHDAGLVRLSDAEFIIDVGFGVGNRDGYDAVIEPLERELRRLGVRSLMIGGSRKVTEELHVLPADRQIGQSGVSVNPRVLLAIGVSGAPQHLNYIGTRASILAFNRDPEAPLMTLNQRQAKPKVYPVIGDLFETVPALVACLRDASSNATPSPPSASSTLLYG